MTPEDSVETLPTDGFDMTIPRDKMLRFRPPNHHQGYAVVRQGEILSDRPIYHYGAAYEYTLANGGFVVRWDEAQERYGK